MSELTVEALLEHCVKLATLLFGDAAIVSIKENDDSIYGLAEGDVIKKGYEAWIQEWPDTFTVYGKTVRESLESLRALLIERSEEVAKALREVTTPPIVRPDFDDLLVKYDAILRTWPAKTMKIVVERLRKGLPVRTTLSGQPGNGSELYDAIMVHHGKRKETKYDVTFIDAGRRRGQGHITMPDTRPAT